MNQDYIELIDRVRKIDGEAADYLETEAKELRDFKESDQLTECFYWDESEQGFDYWDEIADKLGEWN